MGFARRSWAPFAVLLALAGCNVTLTSFTVPPRVWAGEVFEMVVAGSANGQGGEAAVILQIPNGFVVEGALALVTSSGSGLAANGGRRDDPTLLALMSPEPGHYLTSFSGFRPTGLVASHSVELKVYVRAPQTIGGPFTVKAVGAGVDSAGVSRVTDPVGATSFAAITAAPYVQTTTVVAGPVAPFVIDTRGLLTPTAQAVGTGVALGDVDGDGKDDLAYAVSGQPYVTSSTLFAGGAPRGTSVWLSRPGSAWVPHDPPAAAIGASYLRVAFGDFDGDGYLDFADTAGRVLFSNGGLAWTAGPQLPLSGSEWGGVATGDVDGDGLADVAFSAFRNDTVQVFRSQGNRTFVEWSSGLPNGSNPIGADRVALQDVTGDGIRDLVTGGFARVWIGDGRGGWTPSNTGLPPFRDFAVADLNRDGRPELVVSTFTEAVAVYQRVAGIWQQRPMPGSPAIQLGQGTALAVLDHDRDGWPDVAVSFGFRPTSVVLLRNLSGQSWGTPIPLTAQPVFDGISDFAVGDVDGDTWPDLAAAAIGEHPIVWRNTGSGLSPYGEPCSAAGFPTPGMAASGMLQIGSGNFAFELSGAQPNGATVLWIGLSRRFAFGQPILPFGLGPLGAPGCEVVASTEAPHFVLADPTGLARVPIAIPNDPTLKRLTVFAQGAAFAPGANGLGWLLSGGLAAKIP